jgi:hypothetical protein
LFYSGNQEEIMYKFTIDSINSAGGILVMWNDKPFKVDSIEYSGKWISVFGTLVLTNFSHAVVGVYICRQPLQ